MHSLLCVGFYNILLDSTFVCHEYSISCMVSHFLLKAFLIVLTRDWRNVKHIYIDTDQYLSKNACCYSKRKLLLVKADLVSLSNIISCTKDCKL